jgi:hypothetical protein
MNSGINKFTMEILKETLNFMDCLLKKCNNENKIFMTSDIHDKYKEDYNKMQTHADRKKIIKLLLSYDKYLNIATCKYEKCFENMNKLIGLLIKVLPFLEERLKIKTPADVVKSIAIINEIKDKKISSEVYLKKYLFHNLNVITYSKLLTLKVKQLKKVL